jgi:SAM-dependent methyltransferase
VEPGKEQDLVNKHAWSRPWALDWFRSAAGFADAGEQAAFSHVADDVRDRPILDIGVGAGRTVELMRSLSKDYVGLDYMPEMVDAATRRHPGVDIRQGDARDLSVFAADTFNLVSFSAAGFDAVDHEDRELVLREARRVLRPGGIFWFSTLNKDGPCPRYRPWLPSWPKAPRGPAARARAVLGWIKSMPRCVYNFARSRHLWRDGEGWSVAAMSAHDYELIVHYTTLALQLAELERTGFQPGAVIFDDRDGRRLSVNDDLREVFSFNIVATR